MLDRDEIDRLRWANCTPMGRAAEQAKENLRLMNGVDSYVREVDFEGLIEDRVYAEQQNLTILKDDMLYYMEGREDINGLSMYIDKLICTDLRRAEHFIHNLARRVLR